MAVLIRIEKKHILISYLLCATISPNSITLNLGLLFTLETGGWSGCFTAKR